MPVCKEKSHTVGGIRIHGVGGVFDVQNKSLWGLINASSFRASSCGNVTGACDTIK